MTEPLNPEWRHRVPKLPSLLGEGAFWGTPRCAECGQEWRAPGCDAERLRLRVEELERALRKIIEVGAEYQTEDTWGVYPIRLFKAVAEARRVLEGETP
jgi:hypothetical protein